MQFYEERKRGQLPSCLSCDMAVHANTHTCLCVFVCLASRLFVIRLKGIAGISLCGTRISPFLAKLHDKSRPKVVLRQGREGKWWKVIPRGGSNRLCKICTALRHKATANATEQQSPFNRHKAPGSKQETGGTRVHQALEADTTPQSAL